MKAKCKMMTAAAAAAANTNANANAVQLTPKEKKKAKLSASFSRAAKVNKWIYQLNLQTRQQTQDKTPLSLSTTQIMTSQWKQCSTVQYTVQKQVNQAISTA